MYSVLFRPKSCDRKLVFGNFQLRFLMWPLNLAISGLTASKLLTTAVTPSPQ